MFTSMKTRIFDDFEDGIGDWVNTRGRLTTEGGSITADTDAFEPFSWVVGAAGHHRTQLLSDNVRVKVTIPSGAIPNGSSVFWFCGDRLMRHFYGIRVSTVFGVSSLMIVKGTSPNSMLYFVPTLQSLAGGNTVEGWYDRPNSTIRMYRNGSLVASVPVAPTEIPHGPSRRWCGVIMAPDWWLAPGGNFADFEAWDV